MCDHISPDGTKCRRPGVGPPPAISCFKHGGGFTYECWICGEGDRRPRFHAIDLGTLLICAAANGEYLANAATDHAVQCPTCYNKFDAAFRQRFDLLWLRAPDPLPANKDNWSAPGGPYTLRYGMSRARFVKQLNIIKSMSKEETSELLLNINVIDDSVWLHATAGKTQCQGCQMLLFCQSTTLLSTYNPYFSASSSPPHTHPQS